MVIISNLTNILGVGDLMVILIIAKIFRKEIRSTRLNVISSLRVSYSTCFWLESSLSKARITSRFYERISHVRFGMIYLNSIRYPQVRRISWRKCLTLVLSIVTLHRSACSIHSCTWRVITSHMSCNAVTSVHTKSNSLRTCVTNKWIRRKWSDRLLCTRLESSRWTEESTQLDRFRHARIRRSATSNGRALHPPDQERVSSTKVDRIVSITIWWEHLRAGNPRITLSSKQPWLRTVTIHRNSVERKNEKNEEKKNTKKIVMSEKRIHQFAIQSIKWISRNQWRTRRIRMISIQSRLNQAALRIRRLLNTLNPRFLESDEVTGILTLLHTPLNE